MNIALWIVQIVLALAFAAAGAMKLSQPREKLRAQMAWVDDVSDSTLKLIGGAELLGAIGLILPAALGILEFLTPTAAAALAVVMVLAARTHMRRSEASLIVVNVVLFALAAFVAFERFGPNSF